MGLPCKSPRTRKEVLVAKQIPVAEPAFITSASEAKGGNMMSEIRVKDNESLDNALKRFKRSCAKSGVLAEVRKREHYEKPSVKRKKKSEAARKRKY